MSRHRVLVVDDDEFVCEDIAISLEASRFEVDKAFDRETAFSLFRKRGHHIVITDLHMRGGPEDGMKLLKQIKDLSDQTAVMILTSYNEVEKAVAAMRAGAVDYLTKPYESSQIAVKAEKLADRVALQEGNARLRGEMAARYQLVGVSADVLSLRQKISRVAKEDARRVLILGPNGSGKEVVAGAIRSQSSRADKPFVALNCGAIPESLFEGELFGAEKGAYTHASEKRGKLEQAHEGILFLDEIGEMSLANQVKLLRVIETGEVTRLGGEKPIKVDVRIISATNRDLEGMVEQGRFREDLYYRLNVVTLRTTPLRDRPEDIPVLIEHLLAKMGRPYKVGSLFTKAALELLMSHGWPGNVRELGNVVERLIIFSDGEPFTPEQIQEYILTPRPRPASDTGADRTLKEVVNDCEREYIRKVILATKGNMTEAARKLDLKRPYLYDKMKNLGMENLK